MRRSPSARSGGRGSVSSGTSSRVQVGAIDPPGTSLALVGGMKTVDRIVAYGARESEDLLISLIKERKTRGRPTEDDREIRVSFRNEHSTLRHLCKASVKR